MKILNAAQIRATDQYTIEHEPIASIDLMERAARAFCRWFELQFPDTGAPVIVFCGSGNNGGDGLAIARMLHQRFYSVAVYLCRIGSSLSPDCQTNLNRLPPHQSIVFEEIMQDSFIPGLPPNAILIDAIFGTGLNRAPEGFWGLLIEKLSDHTGPKVAVDVPSGLFADDHTSGPAFKADYTFTFQCPKLAFLFAENEAFTGEWIAEDIGLDQAFMERQDSPNYFVTEEMVRPMLKKRSNFTHKGNLGHALLICGSYGMIGASILSSRACLRSGTGLLTVHTPRCGYSILQSAIPEAMANADRHELHWTESPDLEKFSAIGLGCGIGHQPATRNALEDLLRKASGKPLVLDADALNLIAAHQLHHLIPRNALLTPHPKEFERLFGPSENTVERLERVRQSAIKYQCFIILKGAYTCTASPEGHCYFNSTGNPGMATAGSGDVLTGILTGLLAQGYAPQDAAILGVYLHGLAGDIAASQLEHESLLAGDIVDHLGRAFHQLKHPQ